MSTRKMCIRDRVYPMHYHGEKLQAMWEMNAGVIAGYLEGGRTGAFITLGDPAVYSTFMYTLPYIERRGVTVEVVPGVPSFCAVADSMKMPLAAWSEDLLVMPVGRKGGGDLGEILRQHDNVVFMKPSANQEALVRAIRENGLEDSFVLVTKSGTGEERLITDFEELEQYDLSLIHISQQPRPLHKDAVGGAGGVRKQGRPFMITGKEELRTWEYYTESAWVRGTRSC